MIQFDWYILGTILSGLSSAFFGCLVFFYNRTKTGLIFLAFSLAFSLWTLPYAVWIAQPEAVDALFWSRLLNLGAVFIPIFYIHWIVLILNVEPRHKRLLRAGYIATILYAAFSFSPLFIDKVVPIAEFPFWPQANVLYAAFLFTLLLPFFAYGIFLVGKTYFSPKTDPSLRAQSKYVFIGSIMSTIGGIANFPLMFGIPFIAPQLTLLTVFHPMFWAYGSMRHKILNVKTIATEIFVFGLWIFILARTILFQNTSDQLIEGILLLITLVFGVFLIRSVDKEVEQREHIQKLAHDLERANVRLTELDKQKSEFVSFATHQLRSPLTAMKGYASLMLEGEYGEIKDGLKDSVKRIYESADTLINIVNDYLNISRIELGTMKYAFETIDLKAMIEETIAEIKPNIDKSGVQFSFAAADPKIDYYVTADKDKLKQVFANLIDNSVKYTPKGWVKATLSFDRPMHRYVFKVEDNGIGIDPAVLPYLFQKFSRAGNAHKVNIRGTGLGLFVAKQMVEAHHGTIRAESPGEGKGSTFIVELEPFGKV